MRNAHHGRRFGLVLGAGVSKAFKFPVPDWKQLLERMASHPRVQGLSVDHPTSTFASRSDLLYRHFVARIRSEMENAPKPDVAELVTDKCTCARSGTGDGNQNGAGSWTSSPDSPDVE